MSKKKGRPKKTKLQKDFENCKSLLFSEKAIKAALEAGFVQQQIVKFKDEESLKLAIIAHKPGLAVRFIERPPLPEKKEVEYTYEKCEFDVSVLPCPLLDHMRKESQDVKRMVMRKGISVFDILNMLIERSMTTSKDGRKHSKVTINYRRGT